MGTELPVIYRRKGFLHKRRRGLSPLASGQYPIFQRRLFVLTHDTLFYYKEKRNEKYELKKFYRVEDIRIIECVDDRYGFSEQNFSNVFQIAKENTDYMYIAASSSQEREEWIKELRKCVLKKGITLLRQYHPGYFDKRQNVWTCCRTKNSIGCIGTSYDDAEHTLAISHGSCEVSSQWQEEAAASYHSNASSSTVSSTSSFPSRLNSLTDRKCSTLKKLQELPVQEAAKMRARESGFHPLPYSDGSPRSRASSFGSDSGVSNWSKSAVSIDFFNESPKNRKKRDSIRSKDSGFGPVTFDEESVIKHDGKLTLLYSMSNRKVLKNDKSSSSSLEPVHENKRVETYGTSQAKDFKDFQKRRSNESNPSLTTIKKNELAMSVTYDGEPTLASKRKDEHTVKIFPPDKPVDSRSIMLRDKAAISHDISRENSHEEVMKLKKGAMPIQPYTLTKDLKILDDGGSPLAPVDDSTMVAGEGTRVIVLSENMKKKMRSLQLTQPILSLATSDSYILIGYSGVLLADICNAEWIIHPVIESIDDKDVFPKLVAFGSNGMFATAEKNGTEVQLWTISKDTSHPSPAHKSTLSCQENRISSLATTHTPNNPWIAIESKNVDGKFEVTVFDMLTEERKISFAAGSSYCGSVFMPDGNYLIVPELKKVTKRDLEGHPQPLFGPIFPSAVTALCISPGGKHITVGLMKGGMQVIESECGKRIFSLGDPNQQKPVKSLAYWNDGSFLAASMPEKIQLWSTKPTVCKRLSMKSIVAVAFISASTLAYATEDHYVCVYDAAKGKVLYEIELEHAVVMLDVWSNYIVVSSCALQLFEIKKHRLRRIVVMDEKDTTPFTDTSPYLGAFMPNGYFATAKTSGNEVVFWSLPPKDKTFITEACARFSSFETILDSNITRLQGSGNDKRVLLAVSKKSISSGQVSTHLLDCSDISSIREIDLSQSPVEQIQLSLEQYEREKKMEMCKTVVTTIGKCQSPCIPVALTDGNIVLFEGTSPLKNTYENSKVTALACMDENGSKLVAVGYENGKLGLCRGKDEILPNYDETECILKTQVFHDGHFFHESMLYDEFEFNVEYEGNVFKNYPSYSLKIPKGAIPKGQKVHIKTGIMKYGINGPYELPKDIKLVSPVVWFCTDDPDFQFSKLINLELQHCCNGQETLVVLKADHHGMKRSDFFKFKAVKAVEMLYSNNHYCSTEISHFCLYCYGLKENTPGEHRGYRLIPVNRRGCYNKAYTLKLCLTYDLNTCQKAVEEQYPKEDYEIIDHSLWIRPQNRTCKFDVNYEYPANGNSGWQTTKNPTEKIEMDSLDWKRKFETRQQLWAAHVNHDYPPRFTLEINGRDAKERITMKILLTNSETETETETIVSFSYGLLLPPTEEETNESEHHQMLTLTFSTDSGIAVGLVHEVPSGPSIHPPILPFVSQAS